VDFLQHQKFEWTPGMSSEGVFGKKPPHRPDYTMKGRKVASVLRQVDEWHKQLGHDMSQPSLSWRHSPFKDIRLVEGSEGLGGMRVWTITELLTSRALFLEGRPGPCGTRSAAAVVVSLPEFRFRQGDAEIGDKNFIIGVHEEVRWLDVPVDEALLVGVVQVAGGFGHDPHGLLNRQRLGTQPPRYILALHEFGDVEVSPVVPPHVVHGHDAGVVEPGHLAGFGQKRPPCSAGGTSVRLS
jgi:hypothetical protein